jgi:hypothetical protein
MEKKYMDFNDLLELCEELKNSQGFYGRLLRDLNDTDEDQRHRLTELFRVNEITDKVGLIMFIEG